MSRFVLAPAAEADISDVAALERACYSDPWASSAFTGLPGNPAVHFPVVRDSAGGQLAGYAVAWFAADEGELANLAVAPDHRGLGIGGMLVDSVIRAATARSIRALFLEVRDSNLVARKLYASKNFEEVGRRRRYYRSPEEDALILRCTLKR